MHDSCLLTLAACTQYQSHDHTPVTLQSEEEMSLMQTCDRCHSVTYCGIRCQKQDIEQHRTACKRIQLQNKLLEKQKDCIS